MTPKKIRIALIEDHPEYRETIELALSRVADLELIDTFGTAERALKLYESKPTSAPEVLLLDLFLPGASGLAAIPFFRQLIPDTKILVLSQSNKEADVIKAISLGAAGYLLKSSTVRQITDSIRSATTGGVPLDPDVAKYIIDTMRNKLVASEQGNLLSAREMEVLELLAEGQVQKEIAEQLGISPTTVITHVGHIYEKLDAKNAPAAVARAFGIGILPIKQERGPD